MRRLIALALLALAGEAAGRPLGQIEFSPCQLRAPRVASAVDAFCATVDLPEDPAAEAGRRIPVRLAWLPSKSGKPEPDAVTLLAGGPGQSALQAYLTAQAALEPLRRRRHIILVEQRGTGESNRLACELPDWKDPGAQDARAARRLAEECLAGYAGVADPRFYTTGDYLRDLEAVRTRLGIAHWNLVGGSYGTRVALDYLRRHPGAVRSVVVASVVPPELALGQDHARNLDEALAGMARRCQEQPGCQDRFGDIRATLGTVRARARSDAGDVQLRHPQTHDLIRVPFSEPIVGVVVRLFTYAPETLALLPLLLHEAAAGRVEALLAQVEPVAAMVSKELAHGMELSVICAEDADLLRPRPEDAGTLMGNAFVELLQAQCAVWPRGARPADFKQPVVSDRPVLLLSGEHDPVTPPRYAEQVARTLSNSRHLVARGQGHTPITKGCVPRLIRRFIEEPAPADLDAACLEALGDTPFFVDFQGAGP